MSGETHKTETKTRLPADGAAPSSQQTFSSAPARWFGHVLFYLPGYLREFHQSELANQINNTFTKTCARQVMSDCNLFSPSSCRASPRSALQSCRVATLSMVSSITSFKSVSLSLQNNGRQTKMKYLNEKQVNALLKLCTLSFYANSLYLNV